MRHKGGGRPWLTGAIKQAALYNRALSDAEVTAAFRAGPTSVTAAEAIACLTDDQRAQHEAALGREEQLRRALDAATKPASIAYAGLRFEPPPTHLLKRGDVKSEGDIMRPGALSAVGEFEGDFGLPADAPEAKRRVKFAEWLADPRNPLPARVLVNRIWQHHFGQGLVSTPSDFGANGTAPSDPQLLDWLAARFVESGWSIKALHRLIMLSAAYRQSSRFDERAADVDSEDRLLWRFTPQRLDAETLRDTMLAVSGKINVQTGGPSFRPFTTTEFNATFYHPFDRDAPEFNRRTVYRMNIISGKEPLLDVFDCPDPSVKTPRRGVTTTPLQALTLMNSSFVQRQSTALAERASSADNGDLSKAVQTAYGLALGREPNEDELRLATEAARERGLRHVCWALLNSSEFIYVQ